MQIFELGSPIIFAMGRLGANTPYFKGFSLLIPGFCLIVLGSFGVSYILRRWGRYASLPMKICGIVGGSLFVILGVLCWLNPFIFGHWTWPDPERETMSRLMHIETCIFRSIHIKKEKSLDEGLIPSIFLNEKEYKPKSFYDSWDHPIILLIIQDQNSRKFLLASAGADGVFHTNDDISLTLDEDLEKQGRWRNEENRLPVFGSIPSPSATVCIIQPLTK